jgi:hypothetical protein
MRLGRVIVKAVTLAHVAQLIARQVVILLVDYQSGLTFQHLVFAILVELIGAITIVQMVTLLVAVTLFIILMVELAQEHHQLIVLTVRRSVYE